jgi:hypothetical protein
MHKLFEKKILDKYNQIDKTASINFKNSMIEEVKNNIDDYPILKENLKSNSSNNLTGKTSEEIFDDMSDYFVSQNLSVYFPYEENFDLANETTISFTWDPMTNQPSNSGFSIPLSQLTSSKFITEALTPVMSIDDSYAYNYPTLIVFPNLGGGSTIPKPTPDPLPKGNNPPWGFQGWEGFLTFNVDHTKIMDADILKVNIPKIRLMEHLGTFFTPTTITIVRSSANLVTDASNNLVFPLTSDSKQLVYKMNIKRKDARNHNWVDANILWDDDWNMSEAEHNLTWASHHTFSGSLSASGNVKLGYDQVKKEVTWEPKVDIAFSVQVGNNCKLRYNNNVSRRAILTQVVGDTGAGTYTDNGTAYSVRTADKMQYYFKPYLTKIVP